MPYSLEQYQDLINTTLRELMRNEWSDIVTDLQNHVAMDEVLKKKRVEFSSGWGYQFNARVGSNSPAANVLLNQQDNPTTADMFVLGTGNLRITTTYWFINEIEIDANRQPARLVNLLQGKKVDAMTSLADLLEKNFWNAPNGSSDVTNPRGVPYWLTRNTTQGFNGGNPAGFTDCGGISQGTYSRWANYTDQYVTISKADFVRKVRQAMVKTVFKPPFPYPSAGDEDREGPRPNDWGLMMNYAVVQRLEELLESQNDNLGSDVASRDGMVTVRRTPVTYVAYLDTDAQNPIYGINWNSWRIYFLEGNYMRETEVRPHPYIHRGLAQWTDLVYDFVCVNRRQNFRITL